MLKKIALGFLYMMLFSGCYSNQMMPEATSTVMEMTASSSITPVFKVMSTPDPTLSSRLSPSPRNTSGPIRDLPRTATFQPTHIKGVIAVNSLDAGGFLIDLASGKPKQILVDEMETQILGWASDCQGLFVKSKKGNVVLVDQDAIMIKELYSKVHVGDSNKLFPLMNSTGDWLAYQIGEGQQTHQGYERQHLEVLSLDRPDSPIRLSLAGGVGAKSWSVKGIYLAFSDFDENMVQQIFIWNGKDHQKKQVTRFRDPSIQINEISWSIDEQTLAIIYEDASDTASIRLFSIDPDKVDNPPVDLVFTRVRDIWWMNDSSIIAHILPQGLPSDSSENEELIRINANGKELEIIRASELPQGITFAGPINREVIGVFSNTSFYTYDFVNKSLSMQFTGSLNIANWVQSSVICRQ